MLKVGTKWANVEITRRWRETLSLGDGAVEDSAGPAMIRLRCRCGYSWDVAVAEWLGRVRTKDCGREGECQYARARLAERRRAPRVARSTITMYFSLEVQAELYRLARERGCKVGRVVEQLVGDLG